MSFSDETVKAKLSALNETQDSIVTVAQWVMFYRRHADRMAQLWLEKMRESNSSKKLNLIYLANEIMQQAKSRKKEDFLLAFMPVMAEATSLAYKGATQEVQLKVRRVVEVWRQRQILDEGIQKATEARIDELDKSRSSRSTGGRLGGSLFGSSNVPMEFQPLTQAHAAIAKAEASARPLVTKANTEYTESTRPDAPVASAPVQAGRLSSLMKSLASAESAVNDGIKARKELIAGVEQLLETHRSKLAEEETTALDLGRRRTETDVKRKEVEDTIFRRVNAEEAANGNPAAYAPSDAHSATAGSTAALNGGPDGSPEVEGFTPPPDHGDLEVNAESTLAAQPETAVAGVEVEGVQTDTFLADPTPEQQPIHNEPPPSFETPPAMQNGGLPPGVTAEFLNSLNIPGMRPVSDSPPNGTSLDPRKRRKMSHKQDDLDEQMFAMGDGIGLDADVTANLGA